MKVLSLIEQILNDVHIKHGELFNTRSLRLTLNKVRQRVQAEGLGFFTKTLPRLGKGLDKALTCQAPLSAEKLGFKTQLNSELPIFMGEFFNEVLEKDGTVRPLADAKYVSVLRDILYCFYKYEMPYTTDQEQLVLDQFEKTEEDITEQSGRLQQLEAHCRMSEYYSSGCTAFKANMNQYQVARKARVLLKELFASFDATNIVPTHGPGAVATKQKLWTKYEWANVSSRITDVYPFDAYFCASSGHVCDTYDSFSRVTGDDLPARVILVPKDSRGPRLISCEPVDFQWVQQGLGRAIVELVEGHRLTADNVHFTDQQPNQIGALHGSETGHLATLDLKEASDRVSVDLVRLLFPSTVLPYLEACRSLSTVMPDGREIRLQKFAPMGSCLCFPVMALTIWAILAAGAPNEYTRERILVYGDDVVVPTAYAEYATKQLESFGLKINRDKCCTSGPFRESCGVDAFKGIPVQPVRFRTVWSSTPSAEVYTSWIAYANELFDRRYFRAYDYIVGELLSVYKTIPDDGMKLSCPSLREVPDNARPGKRRWNKCLHKHEFRVRDAKSPSILHEMDGWSMLLRFLTSRDKPTDPLHDVLRLQGLKPVVALEPFSVRSYTRRRTSILVHRWR